MSNGILIAICGFILAFIVGLVIGLLRKSDKLPIQWLVNLYLFSLLLALIIWYLNTK
jgi:ABC-type amino acid transport system permease subunit